MSERSEKALPDDLRRIVDAGLAWQTSRGDDETFVFRHVLVQAAAYESLLRTTRQRYHERSLARCLSDFQDRRGAPARSRGTPSLPALGTTRRRATTGSAAGQSALTRMAIPEAHGHFARALDGLKRLPEVAG